MFTFIRKQTRPNADTSFFFEKYSYPVEYLNYINENYIKTGKMIEHKKSMSTDNMVAEFTTVWRSHTDFLSFATDDFVYDFITMGIDYDLDNDIDTVITVEKENE